MRISVKNIKKNYHRKSVLTDVSFDVEKGSRIGILGQNGCGKSTLLSILAGSLRADAGHFYLQEEKPGGGYQEKDLMTDPRLRSSLIGYVPQNTPLFEELSALDNLRLWYTDSRVSLEHELRHGLLQILGIEEFLHLPVRKMSGGMKKRVSIACAVAGNPRILLLDEPGAALDLVCKQNIVSYLDSFCAQGGIVIMASHEIPEIRSCSRTLILKNGVLTPCHFDGDIEKLVSEL